MTREELIEDLKVKLIAELRLEDISPDEIDENTPLFVQGLQLDSIDALEIVVMLDRHYKVKIKDEQTGRAVFQNIGTIADHILNSK